MPRKKLFITLSLSALVVFAATASMQTQEEKPKFTNLKVLPKNITEPELDKIMHEWGGALGVRCGFCHARNAETNKTDFASDAKPEKEMARNMMKMTAKINKKFFKAEKGEKEEMMAAVNCYTCHHGSAHPEAAAKGGNEERRGPRPPAGGPGAPGTPGTPGASGTPQAPPVKP